MAIAITLKQFLDGQGVPYELLHHDYTSTSQRSAEAAHVPGSQLAKPVMFTDAANSFVMVVLPADRQVDLQRLQEHLHHQVDLAQEARFAPLFKDCAPGAVPPVGQAYGLRVICDSSLDQCPDVFFEAGDHTDLVHVSGRDFRKLMGAAEHATVSLPR